MRLNAKYQAERKQLERLRDAIRKDMPLQKLFQVLSTYDDFFGNPAEHLRDALSAYLAEPTPDDLSDNVQTPGSSPDNVEPAESVKNN